MESSRGTYKTITQTIVEKMKDVYWEAYLEGKSKEYVVNGAPLFCPLATLDTQILKYNQYDFKSQLRDEHKLGRIWIQENRLMHCQGLEHVLVTDCKGGLRDDAQENGEINIISMGNCSLIQEGESLDSLAERIRHQEKRGKSEIATILNKGLGTCYCLMDLDEEWENSTIESHMCYNGVEEVCMNFALFCKFGEEMIYPIVSGQCRTMEEALYHMELYLEDEISEEEIEEYIEFVAIESDMELPMITRGELVGRDVTYDFDNYIVAWTYYWNQKIMAGDMGQRKITIRPEVVKAMIMDESTWGSKGNKNSERDVMQSLFPGDPSLWILAGVDPELYESKRFVFVTKEGQITEASRAEYNGIFSDGKKVTEKYGYGDGFVRVRNTISIIDHPHDTGEECFYVDYMKVTPNLSIACGIGVLAHKTNWNYAGEETEREGVRRYNGGGNPNYLDDITSHLKELYSTDEEAKKALLKG